MSAGDVLAVVAATIVTILVAVLAVDPRRCSPRTLRDLRDTANALHDEAVPLLEAARDAVVDAAIEVDRVERLVTSAERRQRRGRRGVAARGAHAASAGREGDGVRTRVSRRAAQRLHEGETPVPPARRRRRQPEIGPCRSRRHRCSSGCSGSSSDSALGIGSSWAVTAGSGGSRNASRRPTWCDRWSDNVRSAVSEGRDAMRTREAS